MLEYYTAAQNAYSNWGRDLKRPALYALHSGFLPEGQNLSHFSVQNYMEMAFSDKVFDRIIFCESFSHATNKPRTISEARRLLKNGGMMIIADCFVSRGDLTNDQLLQVRRMEV